MHGRNPRSVVAAAFFVCVVLVRAVAGAQSFDATMLRQPTDLGMPWLLHAGDDPAFAEPGFDDSRWSVVDPRQSLKSYFPAERPNVVWYRLHVKVAPTQKDLALSEWNLGSAFEIYVNGQKLFRTGRVAPYVPYVFSARLYSAIPDEATATGSLVIAIRLYLSSNDWVSAFPAYFATNLTLGQKQALSDHIWLITIGQQALNWFYQLSAFGLGLIALSLYLAQRQQREYLWIFVLSMLTALRAPLQFYALFHNLPAWSIYLNKGFEMLGMIVQLVMYCAFLRIRMKRWMRVLLGLASVGLMFNASQAAHGAGSPLSLFLSLVPELILIAGVVPLLLIVHWRRGNREAGILLVPAVVLSLSIYVNLTVFVLSQIPAMAAESFRLETAVFNHSIGPFTINLENFDNCLFVLSLAIILVLRSTRIAQQQAYMETELAAAREVQQILLPEQLESIPGFAIESAYEPAQQVGGDFFQILPVGDESLLLVVGDVAGKGLPAAMLVSVLVGAIRGVADYTANPAELLGNLNQRLVGRAGASLSTALAARIFSDGTVELANAGHLPPYLDGKEVEIPGALPLGAWAEMRYETVRFHLPHGSRLAFFSDGIVEAQNAEGELFGFERSEAISTQPVAKIIETAKLFGQQDDMTAIAITRVFAESDTQAWHADSKATRLRIVTQ